MHFIDCIDQPVYIRGYLGTKHSYLFKVNYSLHPYWDNWVTVEVLPRRMLCEDYARTVRGSLIVFRGMDRDTVQAFTEVQDIKGHVFNYSKRYTGIDGVAERMRLYCDGIMCVDFELPLGGRIDLANYSCAYIKGYTDCMCDDESDDEEDENSFDAHQAGFKLLLEYFMMTPEEQVKRHSDYAQLIASLISGHMK